MKTAMTIGLCVAATLFAEVAAADGASVPKALSPGEIQQLVRKNNDAANGKIRAITDTFPNSGKPKNFASIESNRVELVRLVSLKEGAANVITPAGIQLLVAQAFCKPLNLRLVDAADKAFQEAQRLATAPDDKARIGYEYAQFKYNSAGDDDIAKWTQAKVDAYNTPGASVKVRLDLLHKGVPGLDYEENGWKLIEGHEDLYWTFFNQLAKDMRFGASGIEEQTSNEHRLALFDKAVNALQDGGRRDFISRRIEALVDLERDAEAEQELLELAATTNVADRIHWLGALGEFYFNRSHRYHADRDPYFLRRAYAAHMDRLILAPANPKFCQPLVSVAEALKDWDLLKECLDRYTAHTRDQKPDAYSAPLYADYYYRKGDYEKAVEFYTMFGLNRQNRGEEFPNRNERFCESLFAAGRYRECLENIDALPTWGSLRDRNEQYRRAIQAKIEEQGAAVAK